MGLSDEDLTKARAKRDKLAVTCSKKLEAAADSITKYLHACNQCYDDSIAATSDDPRIQLRDEIKVFIECLKIDLESTPTPSTKGARDEHNVK